jgi:hypothetical protein
VIDSTYDWTTNNYTLGTSGTTSWYAISGAVTAANRITCSGDINIILEDGCSLTASAGIETGGCTNFSIYGQTNNTGTLALGLSSSNVALGPSLSGSTCDISIHGGQIKSGIGLSNAICVIGYSNSTIAGNINIDGNSCIVLPIYGVTWNPNIYSASGNITIGGCSHIYTSGSGISISSCGDLTFCGNCKVYVSASKGPCIGARGGKCGTIYFKEQCSVIVQDGNTGYGGYLIGQTASASTPVTIVFDGGHVIANHSGGQSIGGPTGSKVIINGGNVIPMRNGKLDFTAISPAPVRDTSVAASARPKAERKKRYVA